ncbi:MAG: hypothetical protein R2728_16660, partial [Chitinophagales bacterium]
MKVIKSSFTFNTAILLFAALLFLAPMSVTYGQTQAEKINATKQVDQSIQINSVKVNGESSRNAIDGSIVLNITDGNKSKSLYSVIYELHEKGNYQVVSGLSSVNGEITIRNAMNGDYFGFQVVRESDSKSTERFSAIETVQHAELLIDGSNLRTTCSKTYTDCVGTTRSFSGLQSGHYYNASASFRPCGFYLDDNCNISGMSQWHCIDGDLSAPGAYTQYTFAAVGYSEMGLTALKAARLNWIICNYSYDASGVSAAVWYITGTGGSNNSIAQAAAAAVPTADGSQNSMTFYKSSSPSVQDMVKWECQTGCQTTVNAGNDETICTGETVTLSASASNGASPYTYYWSENGTQTTVQAESGSYGSGATKETVQSNYNGTGYIEFYQTNGEYFQVTVNVPSAGKYPIKFRVAFDGTNILPHELKINGTDVGDINLQGTGSGNTWMIRDAGIFNLNAGNNTIRITNIANDALDFDEVIIGKKVTQTNSYAVSPTSTTSYTVVAVDNKGCIASDQITVSVGGNCGDPIDEWSYDCGDDKQVDEYGYNANCKTTTTATIPTTSNIFQYVVEIVYKGSNPGSSIQFKDASNVSHTIFRSVPFGSSSNIWVYRGLITGSTSSVTYTNSSYTCSLQSLVVYAFRNVPNAAASAGIFTNRSGYNDVQTITLDIPADNGPRDLTIEVPISEMTTDGRYLLLKANAGGATDQVFIYGPDASLPGGTCCLTIPTLTLNNVAGNVTQVVITVDTRHNQNGQSVNGQSWVIASGVNVDVECFECDVTVNAGNDKSICAGGSTTISATASLGTAPYTYSWNQGLGSGQSKTVSPTSTTTYTVTVTDANGCTATDDIKVTVDPIPNADAGPDKSVCRGESVTLTASGGGTYLWSTGATTASITVSPNNTTTYTVTVTSSKGCSKSDQVIVTVNDVPTANAGPDKTICEGESVTLTASGGGTYLWSTGATTASITVSPTATTNYTVTVTSSKGCSKSDDVKVTVNELPTANAGPDKTICKGESVTLTASGGGTYLWSTGATTASITVSPTATATYTVTVTSSKGCSKSDDVKVTVNELPTANAGPDKSVCRGESVTLTASGGGTYLWSTGATTASITVSPTITTNYTVTVTNSNGCSDVDEVKVTVYDLPTANAGPDKSICNGASVTLTASGGGNYLWSTGATTASITVSPTATTTYTVTVTTDKGCSDSDDVTVTVNPNPIANAGNDVTVCADESVTLSASATNGTAPYIYQWDNALGNGSSKTVNPQVTTTYTVSVTDAKGCTDTDEVTVNVNPTPTFVIVDKACELFVSVYNVELTTNANQVVSTFGTVVNNGGNSWSILDIPNGQDITITATITATGCQIEQTITSPNCLCPPVGPPTPDSGDKEICMGETIPTLSVTVGLFTSVNWYDAPTGGNLIAANTTSYTPTTAGTFYAEAYLPAFPGCVSDARTPVKLTINPLPTANAGEGATICNGDQVTLTATGGGTYLWSTGATTASITVNPSATTTYTVTVTSDKNCVASDDVVVTVNENPIVTASPDQSTCGPEEITISANANGGAAPYTYNWNNGLGVGASKTLTPTQTTTYTVTVTDANGCEDTDEVTITVNPKPIVNAGTDAVICQGEDVQLQASTTSG